MVFRETKKSRQKERARVAAFGTLPDEVLVLVFEDLPTHDLLALRLSCRCVMPVCTTILSQRLTTLYIRPAKNSLQTAVRICEHPALNQNISRLVLLGGVSPQEVDRTFPCHRYQTEIQCPGANYQTQEWYHKFRPWPLNFPVAAGRKAAVAVGQEEKAEDSLQPFTGAYSILIEALAQLPKLGQIALDDSCIGTGFNTTLSGKSSGERVPKQLTSQVTHHRQITGRADTSMMFDLLMQDQLSFEQLSITTHELPYAAALLKCSYTGVFKAFRHPAAVDKLAKLTSLDLILDAGWDPKTTWRKFCHGLTKGATQLEHLRLTYRPNSADRIHGARDETSTRMILGLDDVENGDEASKPFSKMRSFALVGQLQHDDSKYGPQRPVCHVLDVADFLSQHASTLENVAFHNTTFSDPGTDSAPHDSMKRGMEVLLTCPRLRNVVWTVNRFRHYRGCGKQSAPHFLDCRSRHSCGRYSNGIADGSGLAGVELMGAVAEELQVELSLDGRAWDFGEVVRREKGLSREVDVRGHIDGASAA
ncbi:hypothetical protein LTR78_000945 [Recurvomyces mirabilis]|uniref:F-box domain-containing protein n=1 Tax=Recurvomyces mirabilis TaxID=574656 RepID=A0AAE0WWS5_9PEZI|nr:hypothetical protein LTR78_000945 [Recurvomyces mirabilis]KAK5158917.1 hypothetical protein LTS14_003025 [Recurvomyces mirabilis]